MTMASKSNSKYDYIFNRGVTEVIRREELEQLLDAGKPLRLKMGFDPSRADIHLGHTVGLRKLRQFQELGHRVILIVGDWTAQIGDPSGQSATRQMLSAETVRRKRPDLHGPVLQGRRPGPHRRPMAERVVRQLHPHRGHIPHQPLHRRPDPRP